MKFIPVAEVWVVARVVLMEVRLEVEQVVMAEEMRSIGEMNQ